MIEWLNGLSGGAAAFVGTFTGSALGLISLLLGALFNARLNRKRDDRLQRNEMRSVVAALTAELTGLNETLKRNADALTDDGKAFYVPDLSHSVRIMPLMLPKLGLLEPAVVRQVIDCYVIVEQYCESLMMLGGELDKSMPTHRRLVLMPKGSAKHVAGMNRNMSKTIEAGLSTLREFIT